jgi:hypothetical protein
LALEFDTENKITYEELSPSLQNRIKKIIPRGEFDSLENLVSDLEFALNGIRISIVNSLTNISAPKNDQELAIVGRDGIYSCYVYGNSTWIKIPSGETAYLYVTIVQSQHQTIKFYYNTNLNTYSTSSLSVLAGTPYRVDIIPDQWWTAGSLNIPSTGVINNNTIISATPATISTYTLKINGTTNQTITVKYIEPGGTEVTVLSSSSDKSITVKNGTTWTATISANNGYTAGTLSGTSGTVTSNVTISSTNAQPIINSFTVTVNIPQNGLIKVNNVTATANNRVFTFEEGTSVTIEAVPSTGFNINKMEIS